MPAQNILTMTALKPAFGGPHSIRVPPGQIVVITGPSGSGKSQLARAVADLDYHRGSVQLGETIQQDIPAHAWRTLVGYLPPDAAWWGEHVHDSLPAADWALAGFEPDIADMPVLQLSSGQKQRLALLRLLQAKPAALVLDEPTSHLDPDNTIRIERVIKHWAVENQAPVLWISHDAEQRGRVADNTYLVEERRMR